jgi:hypothetical protein
LGSTPILSENHAHNVILAKPVMLVCVRDRQRRQITGHLQLICLIKCNFNQTPRSLILKQCRLYHQRLKPSFERLFIPGPINVFHFSILHVFINCSYFILSYKQAYLTNKCLKLDNLVVLCLNDVKC